MIAKLSSMKTKPREKKSRIPVQMAEMIRLKRRPSQTSPLMQRSRKPRLLPRLPKTVSEPSINTQLVNSLENFSPSSSTTSLKPTFENLITG